MTKTKSRRLHYKRGLLYTFIFIHSFIHPFIHSTHTLNLKVTEGTQVLISPTITGTVLLQTLLRPLL